MRNGYRRGGGHVFFAKYTLNLSYIFIQRNPIYLYNFCQKWLDTLIILISSHGTKNSKFFADFFDREELPDMQRRHSSGDFGGARSKDTTSTFQGRNQWICSTNFGSIEIILKQGTITNERVRLFL